MISLKAGAPTLAFGAGMAGMIAGTFLACRATLKLEATIDQTLAELDQIEKATALAKAGGVVTYGERERGRDVAKVYAKTAWRFTKLYGPAILVSGASMALLTNSHTTLKRRNRDLMVAYAALDRAYQAYRDRYKDDLDQSIKDELDKAETNLLDAVKELAEHPNRPYGPYGPYSPYSRWFNENSTAWTRNPLQNRTKIEVAQTAVNNHLKTYGVVYLNDVYKELGLDATDPGGQMVGWVWDPVERYEIDFDLYNPNNDRFLKGWEASVALDFNVQGLVLELMREKNERRYA